MTCNVYASSESRYSNWIYWSSLFVITFIAATMTSSLRHRLQVQRVLKRVLIKVLLYCICKISGGIKVNLSPHYPKKPGWDVCSLRFLRQIINSYGFENCIPIPSLHDWNISHLEDYFISVEVFWNYSFMYVLQFHKD